MKRDMKLQMILGLLVVAIGAWICPGCKSESNASPKSAATGSTKPVDSKPAAATPSPTSEAANPSSDKDKTEMPKSNAEAAIGVPMLINPKGETTSWPRSSVSGNDLYVTTADGHIYRGRYTSVADPQYIEFNLRPEKTPMKILVKDVVELREDVP